MSNNQPQPRWANTGHGPELAVLSIGHSRKVAVIQPDTAFWALVDKDAVEECLAGAFVGEVNQRQQDMAEEMKQLRFGLKPSAVYFNPTDRCNFNCRYCYLPEEMRKNGEQMDAGRLDEALQILDGFFSRTMASATVKPQLIFHGSEPMMARQAVFAAIEKWADRFDFGLQSNATLLDDEALTFLRANQVAVGISLDAPVAEVADKTRANWNGTGAFGQVVQVMDKMADYDRFNVITTVTAENVSLLPQMVDFYHDHGVQVVMFNPVRCTRKGGRNLKPDDAVMSRWFFQALDRTWELYRQSGRKLVVANFANILAAILGPTGRRLMCDISPCGGGRCFFAVAANGDLYPCSEFIGNRRFKGGNLFADDLDQVLARSPFTDVSGRTVEAFEPCSRCAVRHFCGAPCPAEVQAVSGTLAAPAPYCEFYQEQARYALRLIADDRHPAFLWDGWDQDTGPTFNLSR